MATDQMLKNWFGILPLILMSTVTAAQNVVPGEVTFITAQHIYVRFERTEGIAVKDTLELVKGGVATACLVVSSMSSTSCVCTPVSGCRFEKGDRVQTRSLHVVETQAIGTGRRKPVLTKPLDVDTLGSKGERIRGRLSAATYSTMPSTRENDHRVMYRFSMNAHNISNSKFSAETYLNYRKLYPANLESHPQRTELFNVYSLAVNFAPDSNTTIALGRRINNSASSLGAIDGLQMERSFGTVFAGAIAGFRPDIYTYGLNFNLLEYGGYIGAQVSSSTISSRSTVGLLQQTNSGMVDRRYAYLQHTSTFHGNLNFFSSGELDLYSTTGSSMRLTNLFISSRYRLSRNVDVFASYDSRRRVVYFETFRNDVEVLLDDDDARQGARLRLNVRPTRKLGLGVAYSKRFQADGANASDNIGGNVNFNLDPKGVGRWSVQANRNTSSYVRSDVLSFRHSRTLVPKYVTLSLYYRMVEYVYANRQEGSPLSARTSQRYYGADLSVNLARGFAFMVLGELATILEERNYRLNMSLVKRFDSKKQR
ncbi:MAG: hypothetical protein IPM46_14170 [Flavobacteriales bacterium]|nr:hypothetical protein [Flavobacteriales bacterium]